MTSADFVRKFAPRAADERIRRELAAELGREILRRRPTVLRVWQEVCAVEAANSGDPAVRAHLDALAEVAANAESALAHSPGSAPP